MKPVSLSARLMSALFRTLGAVFERSGNAQLTLFCYREAAQRNSADAQAWQITGNLSLKKGELPAAVAAYASLLELRPGNPEALNNMGIALEQQGDLAGAEQFYRQALASRPDFAAAHNNLGNIHYSQSHFNQAQAYYVAALAADPGYIEALCNLALALQAQDKLEDAERSCREAIRRNPFYAGAYSTLASVMRSRGRFGDAIKTYQRAVEIDPQLSQAHIQLAIMTGEKTRLVMAIPFYEKELKKYPDSYSAHYWLALALSAGSSYDEAQTHFETALKLNPDIPDGWASMGNNFAMQANVDEALACFRKVKDTPSHFGMRQTYLFYLNYQNDKTEAEIFAHHVYWGERFEQLFADKLKPHKNGRDKKRRLKIAYISSDFKQHAVAYFIEPILRLHNRADFHVTCYANVSTADAVTARIRAIADAWRDIVFLSQQEIADLVRRDEIDILVDLSGHTSGSCMPVFAQKSAPVQVSYLGYPNTTGLSTIDYRLTDSFADPAGASAALYSEKLINLPGSFLTYQPPSGGPDVAPPPVLKNGHITFGSFNNIAKINRDVVDLWSQILHAVPDSRLLLKGFSFASDATQERYLAMFQANGIAAGRLELLDFIPVIADHLELYGRIDIALDPFPYNGTTTTCEALWMGVPVIALAGEAHRGRVGVSLLNNVGLASLVAQSPASYLTSTVALANDLERLQSLRLNLRGMVRDSGLTNPAAFTLNLELAYREMWHEWCRKQGENEAN